MRFARKLSLALQSVLDENSMGGLPPGGTGASALGGQFPGGPNDTQEPVPPDMASVMDQRELDTMEKEKQKGALPQDQGGEANRSSWEPLEKKWQQLELTSRSAETKAQTTKQPTDLDKQVSSRQQADAAKQAYQRARYPKLPPGKMPPL